MKYQNNSRCNLCRLFSVSSNLSASSVGRPKPVMSYKNAGVEMERILQENKGKAGVYC